MEMHQSLIDSALGDTDLLIICYINTAATKKKKI